MRKLLFLLCLLPLTACVDADMKLIIKDDTATVSSVIVMGPDGYQMIAASGEDLCKDGVGAPLDDGGYRCEIEQTGTIDEMIAELDSAKNNSDGMAPDESARIERLENGDVRVSFDLAEMKAQISEGGMDPNMVAMMQQAFVGRRILMEIEGNIIETNGEKATNGRSASVTIPLDKLLMQDPSVPDSFVTIVRP